MSQQGILKTGNERFSNSLLANFSFNIESIRQRFCLLLMCNFPYNLYPNYIRMALQQKYNRLGLNKLQSVFFVDKNVDLSAAFKPYTINLHYLKSDFEVNKDRQIRCKLHTHNLQTHSCAFVKDVVNSRLQSLSCFFDSDECVLILDFFTRFTVCSFRNLFLDEFDLRMICSLSMSPLYIFDEFYRMNHGFIESTIAPKLAYLRSLEILIKNDSKISDIFKTRYRIFVEVATLLNSQECSQINQQIRLLLMNFSYSQQKDTSLLDNFILYEINYITVLLEEHEDNIYLDWYYNKTKKFISDYIGNRRITYSNVNRGYCCIIKNLGGKEKLNFFNSWRVFSS